MRNQTNTQTAAAKDSRKLTSISSCGKWKTFHNHAGLLQYLPSGVYFARQRVGKVMKRASLDTDVFTTAKDRLDDKRKELLTPPAPPAELGTVADARLKWETDIASNHALSDQTKSYWQWRVKALLKSWSGLDAMKVAEITFEQCRDWAKRYATKFGHGSNFNNTLGCLRNILKRGGLGDSESTNPAYKVERVGIKPSKLDLPDNEQFKKVVLAVAGAGAPQSADCANLIEFLAYSGCRISEANHVTWADVDFVHGELKVTCGKRSITSSENAIRYVPMIADLRRLLERMAKETNPVATDKVCRVSECEKSLTNACEKVGCARLTHHDLRHLFATLCIESHVDIPTVSRWLGHSDGGALAMRIYGHLRRSHSQAQAARVSFDKPALPANAVPMLPDSTGAAVSHSR